ncbi:MAG: low-specificity L-threonine aldolase [Blastocatellia bacterium]
MNYIDLRSDTVTKPTDEMREAMARAEVGDDVYGEDPSANRLQELAAEIIGKEAAMFVPSGTMGNQLCVKLHTQPGQELILEAMSHMYNLEMAAMAVLSGTQAHPVRAANGALTWTEVEAAIRPHDTHFAQTGLVELENSQNLSGGTVIPVDRIRDICERAHERGIPVHLDGARIFNAAMALGCEASDIAASCDSVMFCLSKGLGAPVGSMIAGSRDFIERAVPLRRMLGGAMRQVGVLAAAGIVALEKMRGRLGEDHANARFLAQSIAGIAGLNIDPEKTATNILVFGVSGTGLSSTEVVARLKEKGVLSNKIDPVHVRFVTHKEVNRSDCETAVEVLRQVVTVQ